MGREKNSKWKEMSGQEMERQLLMVRSARVLLVIPPRVTLSPVCQSWLAVNSHLSIPKAMRNDTPGQ